MSSVQLLFSTTRSPMSWAIRACTWSPWSHVGLVDGDHVIESMPRHGVRRIPLQQALGNASRYAFARFAARGPAKIAAAATSQLSKPYDYEAIVGMGLHRDWQRQDAWFCSELLAWAFQEAGEPLFRPELTRRVTPQHFWMLAPLSRGRLLL